MMLKQEHLDGTSSLIRGAIQRLAALNEAPLMPKGVPVKAQAAVAVLLFQTPSTANSTCNISQEPSFVENGQNDAETSVEFEPELHVLCTTRAAHLRSHPNQASFPGGRVDHTDKSVAETAFRETCEEVNLSFDSIKRQELIPLCTLRPYLSKTALIVHPVVFWLPPRTSRRTLASLSPSPDEVAAIWTYPLRAVLSSTPPRQIRKLSHVDGQFNDVQEGEPLMKLMDAVKVDTHRKPQNDFRTYSEVPWIEGRPYRLHRFRSSHQLIKGLTADVLMHVAANAFAHTPFAGPTFNVHADEQTGWNDSVALVVERILAGAPRAQARWGDGESGDGYGSVEKHSTHVGRDETLNSLDAKARTARLRDVDLLMRHVPTSMSRADVEQAQG